jgi:hypothetical protein
MPSVQEMPFRAASPLYRARLSCLQMERKWRPEEWSLQSSLYAASLDTTSNCSSNMGYRKSKGLKTRHLVLLKATRIRVDWAEAYRAPHHIRVELLVTSQVL